MFFRTRAIWRLPSKKPTEEITDGGRRDDLELGAREAGRRPCSGRSRSTAGPFTTVMRIPRNREFGIGFVPSVPMFFVSW